MCCFYACLSFAIRRPLSGYSLSKTSHQVLVLKLSYTSSLNVCFHCVEAPGYIFGPADVRIFCVGVVRCLRSSHGHNPILVSNSAEFVIQMSQSAEPGDGGSVPAGEAVLGVQAENGKPCGLRFRSMFQTLASRN